MWHIVSTQYVLTIVLLLQIIMSNKREVYFPFFILKVLFTFRERGRKGERERNSNMQEIHASVASRTPPAGDPACNPGMCPDWESNWQPFAL